jgi:hypothetical protein
MVFWIKKGCLQSVRMKKLKVNMDLIRINSPWVYWPLLWYLVILVLFLAVLILCVQANSMVLAPFVAKKGEKIYVYT